MQQTNQDPQQVSWNETLEAFVSNDQQVLVVPVSWQGDVYWSPQLWDEICEDYLRIRPGYDNPLFSAVEAAVEAANQAWNRRWM